MSGRRAVCRVALVLALLGAVSPAVAEPVRVATLLPYVADALRRLPEQAVVVASARRSAVEAVPAGVVDLGNAHAPSLERLASARPQVVVADRRLHQVLADALAASGAEVLFVQGDSVEATFDGLQAVARRVGAEEPMSAWLAEVENQLEQLRLAQPLPTLPLFAAPGSLLVITERTWLGDLLGRLGFASVATGATGKESYAGYLEVSPEVLAAARPRLALLLCHSDPQAAEQAFRRRFEPLLPEAVPVHALDPALFTTNPGLGMADAARALIDLARPLEAAR